MLATYSSHNCPNFVKSTASIRIMKFSIVTVVSALSVAQAWVAPSTGSARSSTALNAKVYYGTSTGNTETIAGYISEAAGLEMEDIADADDAEIGGDDSIIMGAPTWHTGEDEQRSGTGWDDWLYDNLPNIDMTGKKVAIFGCGDSASYADYYCDAAGELYEQVTKAGAILDGSFVGLMTDEDNQSDLSEDRANAWVAQLKE